MMDSIKLPKWIFNDGRVVYFLVYKDKDKK